VLACLETEERERTGISSLRLHYNRVFGYYFEVPKRVLHLVPSDYERRQTLANAERFVTPALKIHEARILGAEERIAALTQALFQELQSAVARETRRLQAVARAIRRRAYKPASGRFISSQVRWRIRAKRRGRVSLVFSAYKRW
ncbi:MAG: DNA mismatch repair protein MutS, partial [Firmicutes bacterium]|nr:DNA mismatch repair protein MutS [Bacillota bacterium]